MIAESWEVTEGGMRVRAGERHEDGSQDWRDAGPPAKECRQHLEARKGTGKDPPLWPLEGGKPCSHLVAAP